MIEDSESNFDPSDYFSKHAEKVKLVESDDTEPQTAPFTIVGNDKFFTAIYNYHQNFGISNIILKSVCSNLMILFSIVFYGFLLNCVNWKEISNGGKHNMIDNLYKGCVPDNGRNTFVMISLYFFVICWMYQTYTNYKTVLHMKQIKYVWEQVMELCDDVKWVSWQNVIDSYHNKVDSTTDSHYIVNRIMRYENFLIAMITKDVFGFEQNSAFSKIYELNIQRCIKKALFKDDDYLIPEVTQFRKKQYFESKLKKEFIKHGILNAVFAPLTMCWYVGYFMYRYVGEYQKNPKALGFYTLTPLAKWKLRDFNELHHVYISRLNNAHPKIVEYLSQFSDQKVRIISKFLSYIITATFVMLVVISYLNSDAIITLFMLEQPIIFYITLFGGISMLFPESQESDVTNSYEADVKFKELIEALHYVPDSWDSLDTKERYIEINKLFKYKWLVFLEEVASIIWVPIVLIWSLPNRAKNIVTFFRENAVDIDKLGIVCTAAAFKNDLKGKRTEDALTIKMSASFANFKSSYPTWNPLSVDKRLYRNTSRQSLYVPPQLDVDIESQDSFPENALFEPPVELWSGQPESDIVETHQ